jgi:hypothetical protein
MKKKKENLSTMGVGRNTDKRTQKGQELGLSIYEKRKAGQDGIWDKGKIVTGPRKRERANRYRWECRRRGEGVPGKNMHSSSMS